MVTVGVTSAFKSEYLGDAYKVMIKAIDDMKQRPHYAFILPVVQSSGMGKSKTIYRIAQDRIVIPMCLRADDGIDTFCELRLKNCCFFFWQLKSKYAAYPPSDVNVRDYFQKAPSVTQEDVCKAYLSAFLFSLLCFMEQRIIKISANMKQQETDPDKMDVDGKMPYSNMAMAFFRLFDEKKERRELYDEVLSRCCSSDSMQVELPALYTQVKKLDETLEQHCKDIPDGFSFIMALDEVHVLYEQRKGIDQDTNHSLFSRLKSVLSDISGLNLCTVALSTATSIASLAPSKEVASSLRERTFDLDLPPPFTELPFDPFLLDKPLKMGTLTLESVGSLEFTAKFGRPLSVGTLCFKLCCLIYIIQVVWDV